MIHLIVAAFSQLIVFMNPTVYFIFSIVFGEVWLVE